MNDIYKSAVDSMCYIFLQGTIKHEDFMREEVINWCESITEDTPKEVIDYVAECIEIELREGWTYTKYGHSKFLEEVQYHIGENYEDVFFYHIVKRKLVEIEQED